jgi:hypothetical protein
VSSQSQYAYRFADSESFGQGGNGTLSSHHCKLHEALVKYPLQLADGKVTLGSMPLSENRTVERVFRQEEAHGLGGMYANDRVPD